MASSGFFELVAFTALASGDCFAVVDVSDTTQAPQGSTKKITAASVFASAQPITVAAGTVIVSTPVFQATETWNDAAVTFTALDLNVTSTASAAASLFANLRLAGVSQWKVTKAGASTQTGVMTAVGVDYGTGTLIGSGNVAINTNKFTVAGSTGNTVIAGTLGVTGVVTFAANAQSITAITTPSALSTTQFTAFASTVSGAAIMGYGTTSDVTLMNRAGTAILKIDANATGTTLAGALAITGALSGATTGAFSSDVTVTRTTGDGGFVVDVASGAQGKLTYKQSTAKFSVGYRDSTGNYVIASGSDLNSTPLLTVASDGGLFTGAATGGSKGAGTMNFAADIYKNNTAYTNPHGGFEYAYTGAVSRYADRMAAMGLPEYAPLSLSALEAYTREHFHFPYLGDDQNNGFFGGGERLLLITEELATHLFSLHHRVQSIEETSRGH